MTRISLGSIVARDTFVTAIYEVLFFGCGVGRALMEKVPFRVRSAARVGKGYAMSAGIIAALKHLIVEIRSHGCDAGELSELQQIANLGCQVVREGC